VTENTKQERQSHMEDESMDNCEYLYLYVEDHTGFFRKVDVYQATQRHIPQQSNLKAPK